MSTKFWRGREVSVGAWRGVRGVTWGGRGDGEREVRPAGMISLPKWPDALLCAKTGVPSGCPPFRQSRGCLLFFPSQNST